MKFGERDKGGDSMILVMVEKRGEGVRVFIIGTKEHNVTVRVLRNESLILWNP